MVRRNLEDGRPLLAGGAADLRLRAGPGRDDGKRRRPATAMRGEVAYAVAKAGMVGLGEGDGDDEARAVTVNGMALAWIVMEPDR